MVTAWGKNLANKTYYDGGVGEAQNLGIANKPFAPPAPLRYRFALRILMGSLAVINVVSVIAI